MTLPCPHCGVDVQIELTELGRTEEIGPAVIVVPLVRDAANRLVREWHRHHKPVVGCRFSLGAEPQSRCPRGGSAAWQQVIRLEVDDRRAQV